MPGNVQLASPTTVLPHSLFSAFEWVRGWYADLNVYADRSPQGQPTKEASRRRWRQTRPLDPDAAIALRDFYEARGGPLQAFYVYDLTDLPFFSFDESGVSTDGRHTARFEGSLIETQQDVGRIFAALEIVEII